MTEEERWRKEERPNAVLAAVQNHQRQILTSRKARLFACGCYRIIWSRITWPTIHRLVEMAEARADRLIKQSVLQTERWAVNDQGTDMLDWLLRLSVHSLTGSKVVPGYVARLVRTATEPEKYADGTDQWQACPEQATLARDIFGNPFRPVSFDPTWRTSTALAIAKGMYESRDFGAIPILADALQEAGCANDDVLNHCRAANGVHVRGCWVVDLVLGKS